MNYLRSEDGAGAAEYALILALLGGGLALSIVGLKNAAKGAVENAALQVAAVDAVTNSGSSSGGSSGSTNATNSTNSTGGGDPNCPSGQYTGAGKCKK